MNFDRRRFLAAAAALPALFNSTRSQAAPDGDFWSLPRELWLIRPHTGEGIREVYWYDGQLNVQGYRRLCEFFRDGPPTTAAVQIDVALLDILRGTQGWLEHFGVSRPLFLNSGYRSPAINARTEGAKRNSYHIAGRAADIRIEGVSAEAVARFGLWLSGGGVGFYQAKNFTHLDSAGIRFWRG